jgi:hypothetical protein
VVYRRRLAAGTYKVTISLTGFATMLRDEIALVSNFTAPLSVQMRVGAVEETVTVTGESPLRHLLRPKR